MMDYVGRSRKMVGGKENPWPHISLATPKFLSIEPSKKEHLCVQLYIHWFFIQLMIKTPARKKKLGLNRSACPLLDLQLCILICRGGQAKSTFQHYHLQNVRRRRLYRDLQCVQTGINICTKGLSVTKIIMRLELRRLIKLLFESMTVLNRTK